MLDHETLKSVAEQWWTGSEVSGERRLSWSGECVQRRRVQPDAGEPETVWSGGATNGQV